jgi:DNA-binding NarL/FixJ family response regulator
VTPIRVLLIDDQDLVRTGIRTVLEQAGDIEIAAEGADGVDALPLTRRHRPDVVLMDLRMPTMDGVRATQLLRALDRPPAVLVLTTFDDDDSVLAALRAGATGFLTKTLRPAQLAAAVRAAAGGDAVLGAETLGTLLTRAHRDVPQLFTAERERLHRLTTREREVLDLVGQGLANDTIAAALHMSPSSVRTYVSRLMAKLAVDNRTQAALVAYEDRLTARPGYHAEPGS